MAWQYPNEGVKSILPTALPSLQLEADLFAQKLKRETKTKKPNGVCRLLLAALKITWKI